MGDKKTFAWDHHASPAVTDIEVQIAANFFQVDSCQRNLADMRKVLEAFLSSRDIAKSRDDKCATIARLRESGWNLIEAIGNMTWPTSPEQQTALHIAVDGMCGELE